MSLKKKRAVYLVVEALEEILEAWVNPADGAPFEDGEVPAIDKARAALKAYEDCF